MKKIFFSILFIASCFTIVPTVNPFFKECFDFSLKSAKKGMGSWVDPALIVTGLANIGLGTTIFLLKKTVNDDRKALQKAIERNSFRINFWASLHCMVGATCLALAISE